MKFDIKNTKYYLVFVVIIFGIFSLWYVAHEKNFSYPIMKNITTQVGNTNLKSEDNNYFVGVIKSQAQLMGQALISGDYKTFITYTYPKVIEIVGGEKNLVQLLSKSNLIGYKLIAISIGSVSNVVVSGSELQAVVSQTIVTRVDDGNEHGRLLSTSSLVAISQDGGKNWTFVDTSDKSLAILKGIIPTLSNELVIPAMSKPVFYPSPNS